MAKTLLLNKIMSDGSGDFSHFIDIYCYFRDNCVKNGEHDLVPVICCEDDSVQSNIKPRFDKILQKLKELKIPLFFYGNVHAYKNKLSKNTTLIQLFADADQIINISYAGMHDAFGELLEHIRPTTVLKHIGEHESPSMWDKKWIHRTMGLAPDNFGIKIKSIEKLGLKDAFSTITQECELFASTLLSSTQSTSFEQFKQRFLFTSAYFHYEKYTDFCWFMTMLAVNEQLPKEKNIAIYLSSNNMNMLINEIKNYAECFKLLRQTNVKYIKWIGPDSSENYTEINPTGNLDIAVFYGFNLPDKAYQALYQTLDLAAVSGDNTLEQAISNKILPYYRSYNYNNKFETLKGIKSIIRELVK